MLAKRPGFTVAAVVALGLESIATTWSKPVLIRGRPRLRERTKSAHTRATTAGMAWYGLCKAASEGGKGCVNQQC